MPQFQVQIRPFEVPLNVVLELPPAENGLPQSAVVRIPLSDLNDETLLALIDEFTTNVMKQAGRTT